MKLGAFSPTSRALAELMIKHAAPDPHRLHAGARAGTGAVTEALLDAGIPAERVVAIEYDEGFYRRLRQRFPQVNLIRGDALDLQNTLGEFRGIRFSAGLSGLPLLNIPKAKRAPYLEGVLDRLVPGGDRVAAFLFAHAAAGGDPRPPRSRQVEVGDVQPAARAGVDLYPALTSTAFRRRGAW